MKIKPHLVDDLNALVPSKAFSRRDFVRTSVGTGFAAATLPISAQTVIKTSVEGLEVGEVNIPVGNFKMPAYRAVPRGKTNAPVVLVISEIFGVHEHIADVARRFAQQGYCAIAPELFVRQGDPATYGEIARLMAEVVSQVPDEQVMADLDATAGLGPGAGRRHQPAWASPAFAGAGASPGCMPRTSPQIKAGVAWYGRLVGETARR